MTEMEQAQMISSAPAVETSAPQGLTLTVAKEDGDVFRTALAQSTDWTTVAPMQLAVQDGINSQVREAKRRCTSLAHPKDSPRKRPTCCHRNVVHLGLEACKSTYMRPFGHVLVL
jgi:hypothetical protein